MDIWKCQICAKEAPATAHQKRQKYCSYDCMAKAYAKRMVGKDNPNYQQAGLKTCQSCGGQYKNYQPQSKFCSQDCYNALRDRQRKPPKPQKTKTKPQTKSCAYCHKEFRCNQFSKKTTCSEACALNKRLAKHLTRVCITCGKVFRYFRSQNKVYCSYQCHLDNHGAFKAGIAAAEAKLKYGAKKDANHNEIMEELRKHCAVYDMSSAGMGLPDGLAWINNAWHLFDIKNPKTSYGRRGLNNVQKKWLAMWKGGPVYLIYTVEEAAKFGQGNFEGIKFATGGAVDAPNSSDHVAVE